MKNKSFKGHQTYKHAANATVEMEPDEQTQLNSYLPVENLNNIQQLLGSEALFSDAQQRRERNATLMNEFTQLTNQLRSSEENVSVGQGIQLTHAMAQCLGLLSTLVSYAELSQTCVDSSQTTIFEDAGANPKNTADELLRGPENPSVWTPEYNQRLIDAISAFSQRFAGILTEVRERSEVRIAEVVADGVRVAGLGLLSDLTEGLLPSKYDVEEKQRNFLSSAGRQATAPVRTPANKNALAKPDIKTETSEAGDGGGLYEVAQLLATANADVNITLRTNDSAE